MLRRILAALTAVTTAAFAAAVTLVEPARAETELSGFLAKLDPKDLNPAADAFGPVRSDVPVVPLARSGTTGTALVLT